MRFPTKTGDQEIAVGQHLARYLRVAPFIRLIESSPCVWQEGQEQQGSDGLHLRKTQGRFSFLRGGGRNGRALVNRPYLYILPLVKGDTEAVGFDPNPWQLFAGSSRSDYDRPWFPLSP